MSPNPNPRAQFRAGTVPALSSRLREQTDPYATMVAQRDLNRYYALLERVRPTFTEGEASLIVDALNGTLMDEHTAHLLWAEIDDAIRLDQLDEKWHVDGSALVDRLRALSLPEAMAVVDASERFWLPDNRADSTEQELRAVGLVRDTPSG